jgi:hypothetical protein
MSYATATVTAYVTTITYDDKVAIDGTTTTGYYIEQSTKTFSSLEVLANYLERHGFKSGTMLQPVYLKADVFTGTWGTIESTVISMAPLPVAVAAKYAEMNCG